MIMLRWLVTKNNVKLQDINDMFEKGGLTRMECRQKLEAKTGPVLQYKVDGQEWADVPTTTEIRLEIS